MATAVIMPKAGMSMEEGTVVEWRLKEGDTVTKGDVLLEIETDKVTMDVEAEVSGTLLRILAKEGEVVAVITTIGWIGEAGEEIPESGSKEGVSVPASAASVKNAGRISAESTASSVNKNIGSDFAAASGTTLATPAARVLAAESGVDLVDIRPSGSSGEVRLRDVESLVHGMIPAVSDSTSISPLASRLAARDGINTDGLNGSGPRGRIISSDLETLTDRIVPMNGIRKATVRAMNESHSAVPPVTLNAEADISLLMQVISKGKKPDRKTPGLNDFLLKAVALSLKECRWMNSRIDGNSIVEVAAVNLGVAVAVSEGLLVPVLKGADRLTVAEIQGRTADLVTRARDRKLLPDEMQGATFSVSNLGMYGVGHFTPVIPLPQSAILGVGKAAQRVRLESGQLTEDLMLPLSLTIDHRIIDGAQGALFLKSLADRLADPLSLLS